MPIKKRPYQTTPENRRETDHQVEDALESLWSSSIVLIQKKNRELRFCVDFHRINKVVKMG